VGCGTATLRPVAALGGTPCTIIAGAGTSSVDLAGNNCEIDVKVTFSNWACIGEANDSYQGSFGDPVGFPAGISAPAGCAGFAGNPGDIDACVRYDATPPTANGDLPACSQGLYTCGNTQIGSAGIVDAGGEYNAMFGHFHVDAGFTGSASLTLVNPGLDTFIIGEDTGNTFPIEKIIDAVINVPTGRCCEDPCVPDVTLNECSNPQLWNEGVLCPADGGPDCRQCFVPADCPQDAAGACTANGCTPDGVCTYTPTGGYVPGGPNCCNPANGASAPRADSDPCTADSCTIDDAASLGVPQHPAADDGSACDDGNPCTADDQCVGGLCGGTNVNGELCTVDADCQHGGDTPGAVCDNGECSCSLAVNVSFGVVPGSKEDPNCFSEGEKITINVHLGASAVPLTGGQFYIDYDPSCLDFNSIMPTGVWPLELQETVNEATGRIFWAGGVNLGGNGNFGNVDVATMSFTKLGGCTECSLCYLNENPIHTRLTDNEGQSVQVEAKCSKDIRQSPTVTISGPDSTKVNVACNSATRTVNWPAVSVASDCENVDLVCQGEHVESGMDFDALASTGGVFPVGNSNFCCHAANSCGNSADHCWTVTVNDETCLDVEIQLSPTMVTKPGGGITRCIKFEVFSNCVQPPLVFEDDMTFGGLFNLIGHFNGNIKIPSQVQPVCISARDQLHTLRGCYLFEPGDCRADGCMEATFKGDPFFGGNWLVGGNLDGWKKDNPEASHDVIDILDFGQIVGQWLQDYGTGDTPCGTDGPNADINGDGMVDLLDFSFISTNFLDDSKDCCCPGSASTLGNTQGRTSITVNELQRAGMGDLAVADLNADGVVDLVDMQALMQGVRPQRQAPERDGKGGDGSRSFNR
jgi:hypothetical protein